MRPLHWSALHGHLALLQSLLEMRADATAENHQKQTPDRNVAEKNGWKRKMEIWECLFGLRDFFVCYWKIHPKQTHDQRNVSEFFGDVKMHPPEICEIDNLGVFKKIRCPIHLNPSRVDKFFAKIVCICKFMASLAKPHDEPVLAHKSTFEL